MKKVLKLFVLVAMAFALVLPFNRPETVHAESNITDALVGQTYRKSLVAVDMKNISEDDFASDVGKGTMGIYDMSKLTGLVSDDPETVEVKDFKKTKIGVHTFGNGATADEYKISWTAVTKKPTAGGSSDVALHPVFDGKQDLDYYDLYVVKAVDPSVENQMFRLYNPNSGEHFYTSAQKEKDHLVSLGWKDEGTGWYAPVSGAPVYRLYNANGGEHHYTMSEKEKNALVNAGWKDEGIGWYSSDEKGVPVYRQYNPNAFANNHNYTTDSHEKDGLVSLGWKDEAVGWYGTAAGVITEE